MELIVFALAGAMVIGGAIGVVLRTHPVHAALNLILTLFGVAVLFVAQDAHFLAAVEVIVYAGAIVVLFLFVIMLLGVDKAEDLRIEPFRVQRPVAIVMGVAIMSLIGLAVVNSRERTIATVLPSDAVAAAAADPADGNVRAIARDVFSDHVLAFELTSVLLVIAVVGTVILARKPRKGELTGSAQ
jgi:NADH-quinone oxidoreductase subunit J